MTTTELRQCVAYCREHGITGAALRATERALRDAEAEERRLDLFAVAGGRMT